MSARFAATRLDVACNLAIQANELLHEAIDEWRAAKGTPDRLPLARWGLRCFADWHWYRRHIKGDGK